MLGDLLLKEPIDSLNSNVFRKFAFLKEKDLNSVFNLIGEFFEVVNLSWILSLFLMLLIRTLLL